MPAKPSYSFRLAPALAKLQQLSVRWIGRRELEEILGVSKTVAWRLLRQCGAEAGPGGALFCDRLQLIERLGQLLSAEGGTVSREIARHERLERQLLAMRSFLHSRETKVVRDEQALALINTRFQNLPPNVTLTANSLHIEFFGTEDFLQAMGAVVFALQNDYEKVSAFIEGELDEMG
jgi:hypothetical protein